MQSVAETSAGTMVSLIAAEAKNAQLTATQRWTVFDSSGEVIQIVSLLR